MRGPLWRGWLWTPRIWAAMTFRRTTTWYQHRSQRERRLSAARPAAPARGWHRPWWWRTLAIGAAVVVGVWVLTQLVLPLWNVTVGHWRVEHLPLLDGVQKQFCTGAADQGQCKKISDFLGKILAVAIAFVGFYLLTFVRVYRRYQRIARERPEQLVSTSNDTLTDIVGRDELCEVLIERIRDPEVRCPMVLVGGVGSGKSAVMVRLAHQLARRRIVPIALAMRDIADVESLDFEKAARDQFTQFVDPDLWNGGQADRLWRQLRWSNQIAVLADGLEELGRRSDDGRTNQEGQYDSVLRQAFTRAADNGLPLVAATRPYDPLRSMPAVVVELEPLSESHALTFGLDTDAGSPQPTRPTVAHLINDADVTESPLYLKIIRDLNRHGRLPEGLGSHRETGVTVRPVDRWEIRWRLLNAWRQALLDGYICEDFAHDRREREHALDVVSAFACIGLLTDSPIVRYDQLRRGRADEANGHAYDAVFAKLRADVEQGLDPGSRAELVTAATTAGEFSIVTLYPEGVRFQHGVIQAYLAERFLADQNVRDAVIPRLVKEEPSRESLIALVLLSRDQRDSRPTATSAGPGGPEPDTGQVDALVNRLFRTAHTGHNPCWRLEMYAAALEIDAISTQPRQQRLATAIWSRWHEFQEGDVGDRPLDEAKLGLVRRWGGAARVLAGRRTDSGDTPVTAKPAYAQLFHLAAQEASYRVQLAAAREIGVGGTAAAEALRDVGGVGPDLPPEAAGPQALWPQRLRAWLAPLLVLSTTRDASSEPSCRVGVEKDLAAWLDHLSHRDAGRDRRFGISLEIALAQGFRLAANVRHLPIGRQETDRSFLVEKAEFALAHSRFWHSHLVLMQALTLLSLPMDPSEPLARSGAGANPIGLVQHWLRTAGSEVPRREQCSAHPFLLAAARLCVSALVTRQPERFCWIDEGETAGRVGSCSPSPEVRRNQRVWIPDSTGWSVLEPTAERLLADVMLLLNLADRGDSIKQREDRLHRADRCDLPPCLTAERAPLEPERSTRQTETCVPGATCLDDCAFRLCPLPPKGEPLPHRMDQNFCARQADLTSLWYAAAARAPWQSVRRSGMRRFWRQMSRRDLPKWRRW
ncbi:ATP-binding protein [Micromonospora sediminicola]|uniref:ATP-binding protein n=1 Tax=Micromonospora sediminicola TaxID=946078 RepID=UPI0033F4739E